MTKKTICVVGSGWGACSFVKSIDTTKFNVIIVAPDCNFLYTPLLPFSMFNKIVLTIPAVSLNENISVCKHNVVNVNTESNTLILDNDKNLVYDIVVFSHGASVNTFNIQGVDKFCEFIKYTNDIQEIQEKLQQLNNQAKVVVIGCGPTGVETIGHLIDNGTYDITAIDALERPLSMYPNKAVEYLFGVWEENRVHYKMASPVTKITKDTIHTKNGNVVYDIAFWCGGIKPNTLTSTIMNNLGHKRIPGIPVNNFLQIKNGSSFIKNVYAIGDCSLGFGPPTAQKAYQQGKYLADSINRDTQYPFAYHSKGQITYIGDKKSVFTSPYFNTYGRIAGLINKGIMIYNSISLQQMKNICKAYIEK